VQPGRTGRTWLEYNAERMQSVPSEMRSEETLQRELQARASVAHALVAQAGQLLHQGYHQRKDIVLKGEIDPVTQFDRQSEALLVGGIREAFPADAILAEEGGGLTGSRWAWFIDPLDGTVNFSHGIPIFAVSIGLCHENDPMLGLVFDPMRQELFQATRGGGAWLNQQPIGVSATADLLGSLLVTGFAYDVHTNPDNNFSQFATLHRRAQGVRRLGAAAIDLAYVAAGRFDGYWELQIEPWDVTAGALIVREAGGRVTTVDGAVKPDCELRSLLATNGHIHEAMLTVLEGIPRPR
jgi:myo-inositol-1(or 4)-monophosphatase